MKIFIDTNIIVDLLANRPPFSKFAIEIFSMAEKNKIELFTSSHSIATTHYLLKKYVDERKLRDILYNLLDFVTVISIDVEVIKKGLKSNIKDFEDALQIVSANKIENVDYIVTRNIKDFKNSNITVLAPEEALNILTKL